MFYFINPKVICISQLNVLLFVYDPDTLLIRGYIEVIDGGNRNPAASDFEEKIWGMIAIIIKKFPR